MGRPKRYDRDDVLQRAMQLFWAEGFHNTSSRELADAMGINVSTLYSEFESKEGLYTAALDLYERDVVAAFFSALDAPDASMATVRATLRQFPAMARQVAVAPGCLVTNAAIEHAPNAAVSHDTMTRYIARISRGIQHAMTNTADAQRIDSAAVTQFSHQLVAVLIGLFVMSRAQVDGAILDDVAESAVAQLDAFAQTHGIAIGQSQRPGV